MRVCGCEGVRVGVSGRHERHETLASMMSEVWSMLPQIERRWVQGRLVVAMGHTSECGVVVASVGGAQGPCSVLAAGDVDSS